MKNFITQFRKILLSARNRHRGAAAFRRQNRRPHRVAEEGELSGGTLNRDPHTAPLGSDLHQKERIMNQHKAKNREADPANSFTETSVMGAEIDALRKRLAALEESVPGYSANRPRARKVNSRAIMIGLTLAALAVVWMVLERPSVVYSQSSGTDPLTIDKNGNVGIRTTTPSATLDVNGEIKARTASIDGNLNAGTLNASSLRFPDSTVQTTAAPPAHAVIAFNLSACPAGWSEYSPGPWPFHSWHRPERGKY
jgi:hypothetical protein